MVQLSTPLTPEKVVPAVDPPGLAALPKQHTFCTRIIRPSYTIVDDASLTRVSTYMFFMVALERFANPNCSAFLPQALHSRYSLATYSLRREDNPAKIFGGSMLKLFSSRCLALVEIQENVGNSIPPSTLSGLFLVSRASSQPHVPTALPHR